TKGNQTVSALLDKEQEDGMDFTFDEGELEIIDLIINTGPYTDKTTEKQKAGFRMRQSQIAAAKRKRL
ncbi:hypothetical protein IAF53_20195, partial [Acinetobacter baumannii]|nr:hypothetical protein [Acinetobacter baumannii]